MMPTKKYMKWGVAILLTPVLLIVLLAVMLYIPPIQNWAVKQVVSYASEQTGMDISVKRVNLVFPLNLGVEGLRIMQPNDSLPQQNDTIADARKLTVNVRLLPLFRKNVEIDKLDFRDVAMNTANLVPSARIKGKVGRLSLESHGIDLGKEKLRLNAASIADADVDVALCDTVPEDTTETKTNWNILVDALNVNKTGVTVHMPGDTLQVYSYLGKAQIKDGRFDLSEQSYKLRRFEWNEGAVRYDNNFEKKIKGFDYNHIALSGVTLHIDSIDYTDSALKLAIKKCTFREKCGLAVSEFTGSVALDTTRIVLPDLRLRTSESSVTARVAMDFNAFDDVRPGQMNVRLNASLGKQDLMHFLGFMPQQFMRLWPNRPLTLNGVVNGNMRYADFSGLVVKLPTAFSLRAHGNAYNLNSPDRLRATVDAEAETYNLSFVTALLPSSVNKQVRIPQGIRMKAHLTADGNRYGATFRASQGGGSVSGKAFLNAARMAYDASIAVNSLPLSNFLPGSGLRPLSGNFSAKGVGFDFLSPHTQLAANAETTQLQIGDYNLSGMKFDAGVHNGVGHARLDSHNELLSGNIDVSALMNGKLLAATLKCNIDSADFCRLGLTKRPVSMSLAANLNLETDLRSSHSLKGVVGNVRVCDSARIYRPENIVLDVFTRRDSTHASINSGDFVMRLDAHGPYDRLLHSMDAVLEEMQKQRHERYIDQLRLRERLPNISLYLDMGKENLFCRAFKHFGYGLKNAFVNMAISPEEGINGKLALDSLVTSGIQIDTIRLGLSSDTATTRFDVLVCNNRKNPQYVFNASCRGALYKQALYVGTKVYDDKGRLGVALGLKAQMKQGGVRINLAGMDPVLGYKKFEVNKNNYVFFSDDQRISADLRLLAADDMGIQVYTNDSTEVLQDITVGLTKFDLAKVLSVIPYTPDVSGMLNGDFHLINTAEGELSVSSSITIDNMAYEHCPIGNIGSEFVYMPKEGGRQHYVDGTLSCNGYEVCALQGTYDSNGDGYLNADMMLDRTPLLLLNGFVPDQLINFKGTASGEVTVEGTLSKPNINGTLSFDSAYIASDPYGVEMRLCEDKVKIENSHMTLDAFKMFAHNGSPLTLTGYLDFSDLERMYLEMRVRADNYLLIDSKENKRSEAYGKAYVNFRGMIDGPLEALRMRGYLGVLGSTDLTYILRNSPLTTDNQLDGLVKFVNFNAPHEAVVTRPPLSGFKMDLSMSIDEGAHVLCALNADQSNYVDIIGGGDLRMQYDEVDGLRLFGRYTLNNGEMKYSLPVIPLKTFTIQDGSYIEFMGDVMNPRLNITATEENKATVNSDGGQGRSVAFECGVVITKTLNDMGLQFTIDAPDDQQIHNELMTMSAENRGKIAVTMLTTGMYLADGNTNSFSMNSALSAFLNSQINAISGNALRTLDLSFGMDNTTLGSGAVHTDYSFKFSKRFWNNRLRIVIGGKVSSGAEVENQNDTFFDNVTFEYRISPNSNQYLKLFYDRDTYDWLEGYVGQFGGGFLWRRKLQHFRDIFRFKKVKQAQPVQPADSTLQKKKNESEK